MPSVSVDEKNTFSWKDITYSIKKKRTTETILHGVSGSISSGRMLAVMGPSGAGKSTFLDVLAQRKASRDVTGILQWNQSTDYDSFRVASYVEQDDALLGALTVRESISYSARLDSTRSRKGQISNRVEKVLDRMGLNGISNSKIGNAIQRGISGGQKRRVTVALSVVAEPELLFLDEPTSGLDSHSAFKVIESVKTMVQENGMIAIATIHQPSYETLSLFDDLLVLAKGRAIYYGEVDNVLDYFDDLGFPCLPHANPADHIINLVNDDFEHDSAIISDRIKMFAGKLSAVSVEKTDLGEIKNFEKISHLTGFVSSIKQTGILVERTGLNYTRNLLAYGVRVGMYLGMGIMLALIWMNIGTNQNRINDRLSVHFYAVAFLSFMSVAGIPAFLEERAVFLRERSNGLYGTGAYVFANSIVNIPFLGICVLLFSIVAYWSIGLHPGAGPFFKFVLFLYLAVYAAESQSVLIAAFVPIFIAALAIAAFVNGLWMSVQGFFNRNLAAFWQNSFHYMDYETYAFQLLVNNDLKGLTFQCGTNSAGNCSCMYPSTLQPAQCAFTGEDVLTELGYEDINYGNWISILVCVCIIYRILFYIVLVWKR